MAVSEHKIILDPRLSGKEEYHITLAYVESVMTDEERAGLYEPTDNVEVFSGSIDIDIGAVTDLQIVIDKLAEMQEEMSLIPIADVDSSEIIRQDDSILLVYQYSVTTTIHTDPSLYFQSLWQSQIKSFNLQPFTSFFCDAAPSSFS